MRSINVLVPQGIGDIFWCYQKLSPYYDEMHFKVGVTERSHLQQRAGQIISVLPKVKSVQMQLIDCGTMSILTHGRPKVQDLLDDPTKSLKVFTCNGWLYDTKLEDIDPGLEVHYDIPLPISDEMEIKDPYIVLYVSASTMAEGRWTPEEWARFVYSFKKYHNLEIPIVMVGAEYDRVVMDMVEEVLLIKYQTRVHKYINFPPHQLFFIIKHAKVFIGFQSGLNVIADNLDVRQLIVYFSFLRDMKDLWGKPRNRGTLFHYCWFDSDMMQVIREFRI